MEVPGVGSRCSDGDVVVDLDLVDDATGAELSDWGAVTLSHLEREPPPTLFPWQRLPEVARG